MEKRGSPAFEELMKWMEEFFENENGKCDGGQTLISL
jgi:hypothetical protein